MLAALRTDGVVLQRQAWNPQWIDAIRYQYEDQETYALSEYYPKDSPILVYWTHVQGQRKKMVKLSSVPFLSSLAMQVAWHLRGMAEGELRLLETIVFNKPPKTSNVLRWHQDVSYFPFNPNNQLAVWIPFDVVTKESGAMVYALGTHLMDLRASTDLHSGKVFHGEKRNPIPDNPEELGIETRCYEMEPGDMLIHDGRTWHMSGPNITTDRHRRGLSLRFLVGETRYAPQAGSAAAFIKQLDVEPGDVIDGPAFPVLA